MCIARMISPRAKASTLDRATSSQLQENTAPWSSVTDERALRVRQDESGRVCRWIEHDTLLVVGGETQARYTRQQERDSPLPLCIDREGTADIQTRGERAIGRAKFEGQRDRAPSRVREPRHQDANTIRTRLRQPHIVARSQSRVADVRDQGRLTRDGCTTEPMPLGSTVAVSASDPACRGPSSRAVLAQG